MAIRDEIVARTYQLLGEPSDVEEFDETEVVLPKIENVVGRICKWIFINPVDKQVYRWGYLPFLDASVFYTGVLPTSLTAAVATSDTTISFDATGFLTASVGDPQYIYVNGDIIKYTWKTSTTITGVTGIGVAHSSGDTVYQLYKLPSQITKPFSLRKIVNSVTRYKIEHLDFRKEVGRSQYYTILRDGTTDLLNIVGYGVDKFQMIYVDKNTTMSTWSTECIIPECTEMVAHLSAGELLWEYEEYDDGKTKIDHWCALLAEMYAFYAKQTKDTDKRIVTGNPVRFSHSIPWYGKRRSYFYR